MDFTQITQRISDMFAASGHQVDPVRITEKLTRLIQEFGVPLKRQNGPSSVTTPGNSDSGQKRTMPCRQRRQGRSPRSAG